MSENAYQAGQRILTECRFQSRGANADPSTVTVKLVNPQGGVTTKVYGSDVEVVRDGTGLYHMELITGQIPGRWVYRYIGTGAIDAADEEGFRVKRSAIP